MNKLQFAVLWEEQGSETVVYGPFDSGDEADQYKVKMMADLDNMLISDDMAEEFGHVFTIVNFIEVKK